MYYNSKKCNWKFLKRLSGKIFQLCLIFMNDRSLKGGMREEWVHGHDEMTEHGLWGQKDLGLHFNLCP